MKINPVVQVIFPHPWALNSPSLIGLTRFLKQNDMPYILYVPNCNKKIRNFFGNVKNLKKNYIRFFLLKVLNFFLARFLFHNLLLNNLSKKLYINAYVPIANENIMNTIIFDFYGIQNFLKNNKNSVHIFSTEIYSYFQNIGKFAEIQKLKIIIQSFERSSFLGFSRKDNIYIVKNSHHLSINSYSENFNKNKRSGLIYSGTFSNELGAQILKRIFIDRKFDVNLTLHSSNITENFYFGKIDNLKVVRAYLSDNELNALIASHLVGLVFFDFDYINKIQDFNFKTGPSGKLYKYASCLVPVIGKRCIGLLDIETFGCGILLDDINHDSVLNAYQKILKNYKYYQNGCKNLINSSSFEKSLKIFANENLM